MGWESWSRAADRACVPGHVRPAAQPRFLFPLLLPPAARAGTELLRDLAVGTSAACRCLSAASELLLSPKRSLLGQPPSAGCCGATVASIPAPGQVPGPEGPAPCGVWRPQLCSSSCWVGGSGLQMGRSRQRAPGPPARTSPCPRTAVTEGQGTHVSCLGAAQQLRSTEQEKPNGENRCPSSPKWHLLVPGTAAQGQGCARGCGGSALVWRGRVGSVPCR